MVEKKPARYPKIQSPYKREEDSDGRYTMMDEHLEGYEWVNDADRCDAVEKLHGTNCCVTVKNGDVHSVWTRKGPKRMNKATAFHENRELREIVTAVMNTLPKGYIPDEDGHHYGEVVGPGIHGNMHELDEKLFIPFSWMRDRLRYKSWGEYDTSFEGIRSWFKDELFSLFYVKMHGVSPEEASVSNGVFCEGVMFTHEDATNSVGFGEAPNPHNFAKIRREMFEGAQSWPGPVIPHD